MKAEKQAEELIQKAKENRNSKLKQAKDSADEEVKKFRETEEAKYQKEVGARAKDDPAADLKSTTAMEIQMVNRDYEINKEKTSNYIVEKILSVPLTLGGYQKEVGARAKDDPAADL